MRNEVKFQRSFTKALIRWPICNNSPESHQADLNRCTHPWEPLKRPGRKTSQGHKSRECPEQSGLMSCVLCGMGASHHLSLTLKLVQICDDVPAANMPTFKKAFFSKWFIKNGGIAAKTQEIQEHYAFSSKR